MNLPGSQTEKSVRTHSYSGRTLGNYRDLVDNLLLIKRACIITNRNLGFLDAKLAAHLLGALDHLDADPDRYHFFVADVWQGGGGISINTNVNEIIAFKAGGGAEYLQAANLHQSTADVLASAVRVSVYGRMINCREQWQVSLNHLEAFSDECKTQMRQAYTCLQPAMYVSIAGFLSGVLSNLRQVFQVADVCREQLLKIPLGGTVVGNGEGAPEEYQRHVVVELAKLTSLKLTRSPNPPAVLQQSLDIQAAMRAVSDIARVYAKLCRDLRFEQSPLGTIKTPDLISGSSFFKNKVNPTLAETMLGCCMRVDGYRYMSETALAQAELDLNVFEMFAALPLFDSLTILTDCLMQFNEHCLAGLTIKKVGCENGN